MAEVNNLSPRIISYLNIRATYLRFKAGQFEVKPFVVSCELVEQSNHERLNRPPFDKALLSLSKGSGRTVKPRLRPILSW